MDKLALFNAVARVAKPIHLTFKDFDSLEKKFKDSEIDSLDTLLICVYFCELYGISEENGKKMLPSSPQEIFGFLETHKTKEPSSIEEALEQIK